MVKSPCFIHRDFSAVFSARNTIRLGKSPRVCQTAEEALEPHRGDREMLKITPSHF